MRSENKEELKKLEERIRRIEQSVFGELHHTPQPDTSQSSRKEYAGASGGIRQLIDDGFFDAPNKRGLKEISDALENLGKAYSPQAIDAALRRLSQRKGPLVKLKKGAKTRSYVYATRR